MMIVITGQIIKTSFGEMIIHNEQNDHLEVGEMIEIDGMARKIKAILPPSKPDAKWSLMLES